MVYLCRHEELYEEVKDVVIRSDGLNQRVPDSIIRQMFDGVTLVLSTLSMLSNPLLTDRGLFKIIPMRSLVVDEASQIDVFEFMVTVLGIFGSKCFVIPFHSAPVLQILQGPEKSMLLRGPEAT
jgi:hypothetical protein